MDEIVMAAFLEALQRNRYNRSRTAKELGLSIRTIRTYIKKAVAQGHEIDSYVDLREEWRAAREKRTREYLERRERLRVARERRERLREERRLERLRGTNIVRKMGKSL